MQMFEYPYIIITFLVAFLLIIGGVGLHFALQGYKAAKDTHNADFTTVSKMNKSFLELRKNIQSRCIIYVCISLDNVRSLYSDSKAWRVFEDIKPILLKKFHNSSNGEIASYDGKNFVALNTWSQETARDMVNECVAEINRCLLAHEVINMADVRFGIYCSNATTVSFEESLNRARQACTMAEHSDIAYAEWDNINGKSLEKKIKIENNIESEIDNNSFFLEYQPIVDSKTKKIIGAEVLARLNSSSEGVLTPGTFLSAVNSVGVNNKFDYYIFEKNCKWIAADRNQREGYLYTINFSRITLCEPDFPSKIINIVKKYNLSYDCLAIEVLEDKSLSASDRNILVNNLLKLKEHGFRVLLDDFGSGYTTFADLQTLSVDIVKIDKSITQKSNTDTGMVIFKNVIRTAKDLGMKTVCEGIETPEQEEAAVNAGGDILQGYYYYRPVSVKKLEELLMNN